MLSTCLRWLPSAVLLTLLAHPVAAGVDRWTPIGPEGGGILSLAADPDAPGILYAGTLGGGVWKSLDGGGSWAPTAGGLPAVPISFLAVSAGRICAGTFYSDGMFVLTAGAATWRHVGPSPYSIGELAVDPAHPEWIWMAGDSQGDGLFSSQDGGEHWSLKLRLKEAFQSIAVAPTVPSTVYAAGNEGIFASPDMGTTWRQLDPGFPTSSNPIELAADATDAATVYASSTYSGFWKTTDAGAHWRRANDVAPFPLLALPGVLLGGGGEGVLRSEDGGDTWEPALSAGNWDGFSLAADRTAPAGAWLSVQAGSLLHTSDGGRTWTRRHSRGLRASHIRAFAFDPFRPRTLYAATFMPAIGPTPPGRLQKSVDSGVSWSKPLAVDVRALAADPRRSGTLYAGTPRGVSVSRDRGAHWQSVLKAPESIAIVVADPHRPGTIWAGGYGLWRSQDAGGTWTRLPDPLDTEFYSAARRIFLSPWHPETLYLIDFYLDGISVPRALWRSTDGGSTWEPIGQAALDSPVALAFDPVTPDLLYGANAGGTIRKSRDGGTTWEPSAGSAGDGYGLTSLLVDPLDPSVLYAGTDGNGVWRSRDQGVTWEPLSTGMIAPSITCLEADPRDPHRLIACTQGGGLLELRTSSGS